jgi:hypothetical protein
MGFFFKFRIFPIYSIALIPIIYSDDSKIFAKPCCRNKARILIRYRLKLFLPSKFSTSNFAVAIPQNKDSSSDTSLLCQTKIPGSPKK